MIDAGDPENKGMAQPQCLGIGEQAQPDEAQAGNLLEMLRAERRGANGPARRRRVARCIGRRA